MYRAMDKWLLPYLLRRRHGRVDGPLHIVLTVCDHYEPLHATDATGAMERVQRWRKEFPELTEPFRDADGTAPAHTFFYPVEQDSPGVLELLAEIGEICHTEVELHLHHRDDTEESLRAKFAAGVELLRGHGFLPNGLDGKAKFAFVHGDWALDDSYPGGGFCGVRNELDVLVESGCYADFTMPSAPNPTQTRIINSIYYAVDTPAAKSHDRGERLRVGGKRPSDRALLLLQGPLGLNWHRRKHGLIPRLENAEIAGKNPPSAERMDLWLELAPRLPGAGNVVFIKLHTHAGAPRDMAILLGEPMRRFHEMLVSRYNDGKKFSLHYATAREMVNIAHGLEAGVDKPLHELRDFRYRLPN